MKKLFLQVWILVIILCIGFPTSVNAGPAVALDYNPRAEAWIIQQLNAGKEAGLAKKFPDLADRRIRASFLVNLLDHPTKSIALYGISISDATIVGELILKYRDIEFPVLIEWSTFEGAVELCYTHFHRYLSLQGNTFKSRVDFCGLKVDDDVCLAAATFNDSLEFGGAHINGSLIFDSAHFLNKQSRVNFGSAQVEKSLFLNNAIFEGDTNFGSAKIDGELQLVEAQFNNSQSIADFSKILVGKSLFLNNAVFEGDAIFSFAEINGDLQLAEAQFNNSQSIADFAVIQVGQTISIPGAVFEGGATFQNAKAGSLDANDVIFQNTEQTANFENVQVKSLFLGRAGFNGPVRFYSAKVSEHFFGAEAKFLNVEKEVSFVNMAVGQTLDLGHTVFNGAVDFRNVIVGMDFSLVGSEFNNSKKEAMLQYMTIGKNLNFTETIFKGKVGLGQTTVGTSILFNEAIVDGPIDFRFVWIGQNLEALDAQFNNVEEGAYFESMEVTDHILIHRAKFAGPVDFSYVYVGGLVGANDTQFDKPANFSNAVIGKHIFIDRAAFADSVNFENTSLKGFFADGTTFPQDSGKINVTGLTYTEVYVKDVVTGNGFLYLIDQSPFDGMMYKTLEDYYRLSGFPLAGDDVYIHYKFRETAEGLHYTAWQWWWNLFLGVFIVFGKWPEVALIWFALIVGVGYLMFRKREKMVTVAETSKRYRPFLYSLDLFLPIIDLGYASLWKPNPDHKIIRTYALIHRYLGLILIPIAILAFFGIVK